MMGYSEATTEADESAFFFCWLACWHGMAWQVVMSQGGTIEYFQAVVFNFPTLAEAYNVAAADGLRKVDHELGQY